MHDALERLLDEVRLNWHAVSRAAERLHERDSVTLGMRGVLEMLTLGGSATVPQLADRRHVSRQHIQTLVNALAERELVSLEENPKHERSSIVCLTAAGKRAFERMKRRERQFFERLALDASATELESAARTLKRVRESVVRSQ